MRIALPNAASDKPPALAYRLAMQHITTLAFGAALAIAVGGGLVTACGEAAPAGADPAAAEAIAANDRTPVSIQLAFTHFSSDSVSVSVDGQVVLTQAVTVAAENARSGIAGFAQITMPRCSDLMVRSRGQQLTQRLCLNADTLSLTVDGTAPLTITQVPALQGID